MASELGRSVARGSVLGALNLAFSALVTLGLTPIIVNRLGAVSFGYYGLLIAAFGFANLMALGEATLFFCAKPQAAAMTRALGLWHLGAALLGSAALIIGVPLFKLSSGLGTDAAAVDAYVGPAAALWAFQFVCNWLWSLCRARLQLRLLALHQALLSLAAPLSGLALVSAYGLQGFLWGSALAWALGSAALLPFLSTAFQGSQQKADWAALLRYGRWTLLFGISVVLMQSADRMLAARFGALTLAGYALASSLYQRAVSAFGLLPSLLVPAISRMEGGEELGRAKRAYGLSLRFTAIVALAVFVPLAGLGDVFLNAWLYRDPQLAVLAFGPLKLLSAAGFLAALSGVLHAVLLGLGYPRQVALTGLLGAAIGFAVAWLSLPALGIEAAALSGLVGYAAVYALRLAISEQRVFGRKLGPIARDHGLLALAAWPAYLLCRNLAPLINGSGVILALFALALAMALLALAALWADRHLARRSGRESVWAVLQQMRARAH